MRTGMDPFRPGGGRLESASVLAADPDLGARLGAERLARAEPLSRARVLRRPRGNWYAKEDADHGRHGFGLLVIEGMLVRRIGMEPRLSAELLSFGDLLQPSQHDGEEAVLPLDATWRVFEPLKLAVLDLDWAARMAPFPEIATELALRALIRSRRLASMLAITHHHRLDDRLWLFFWELADRFGRVRSDGVVVELPLTHELISNLVGGRRPSVSSALTRLEEAGRVRREGRRWLLSGAPPAREELAGMPAGAPEEA